MVIPVKCRLLSGSPGQGEQKIVRAEFSWKLQDGAVMDSSALSD